MKADYLSYKRAASVSLLGLGLQLGMGLALLLYSIYGRDHAAMTAAMFVLLGSVVWLCLSIVFDQHRRERIEAVEAEAFAASDAAGSSVFERGGDELRVASKRLKTMYKVVLPTVSLGLGAALVTIGVLRFQSGRAVLESVPDANLRYWAMSIGLGIAILGFIFARFVSGMAKQPVWGNLRAGAAYAVGAAIAGLAMAVAQFVDIAGPDVVLRMLKVAFPVMLVVLGSEVFLNFLLDVYRPRKAGETPKAAFESRILGFVAAPDRIAESIGGAINYQFGLDVTGSWFYQLLNRSIVMLVGLGVGVIWLMSCVAVVQPHQSGIVTRFGEAMRVVGPGLHVKLPWPIERVEMPAYTRIEGERGRERAVRTFTSTGVRVLELATQKPANEGPILWTNEHATNEVYMLVQPAAVRVGDTEQEVRVSQGGDFAVISAEIPLHFAISDPLAYELLGPEAERESLIKSVAQREIGAYIATRTVDDVLGAGRTEVSRELQERVQRAFEELNPGPDGKPRGAGVEILFLGIEGVHPPRATATSFEAVVAAEQRRSANVQTARAEATRTLTEVAGSDALAKEIIAELDARDRMPASATQAERIEQELKIRRLLERAGGRAGSLVLEASAARWSRHMAERGRAARYQGQVTAYRVAPTVFRAEQYFQALQDAVRQARLYITSDEVRNLWVRTELQDVDTGADVFRPRSEDGQDLQPE